MQVSTARGQGEGLPRNVSASLGDLAFGIEKRNGESQALRSRSSTENRNNSGRALLDDKNRTSCIPASPRVSEKSMKTKSSRSWLPFGLGRLYGGGKPQRQSMDRADSVAPSVAQSPRYEKTNGPFSQPIHQVCNGLSSWKGSLVHDGKDITAIPTAQRTKSLAKNFEKVCQRILFP